MVLHNFRLGVVYIIHLIRTYDRAWRADSSIAAWIAAVTGLPTSLESRDDPPAVRWSAVVSS